ncbi:MAG: phytanoyl-CoA dioxygenase family protein [Pseudomonadales bacterium]
MSNNMDIKYQQQENQSGDARVATQGFGRIDPTRLQTFPASEIDAAYDYFANNGFVVLEACLDDAELKFINDFYDNTQASMPERWGLAGRRKPHHRNQGLIYSQPLLDHPELDDYVRHPSSFPLIAKILGGKEHVRMSEFNFREAPENSGQGAMNFHHDNVVADRFIRSPYLPCDWVCAIHYLTDVREDTPSFCVVPGSHKYETLQEAYEALADDYVEIPIYGAAGTCVVYDTGLFHTRYDGDGIQRRRTWHQYYARGGWLRSALPTTDRYVRPPTPPLTDWNLFPERLVMSDDPEIKMFFSHWNTAMCEWVASGFEPEVRRAMPRGEQ